MFRDPTSTERANDLRAVSEGATQGYHSTSKVIRYDSLADRHSRHQRDHRCLLHKHRPKHDRNRSLHSHEKVREPGGKNRNCGYWGESLNDSWCSPRAKHRATSKHCGEKPRSGNPPLSDEFGIKLLKSAATLKVFVKLFARFCCGGFSGPRFVPKNRNGVWRV
jgi:hypothetical protein